VLQSELIKIYEAFFINVGRFDSGNFKHSDIELNEIEIERRPPPDFVTGLEQTLDSRPGIASDVRNLVALSICLLVLIVNVDL